MFMIQNPTNPELTRRMRELQRTHGAIGLRDPASRKPVKGKKDERNPKR